MKLFLTLALVLMGTSANAAGRRLATTRRPVAPVVLAPTPIVYAPAPVAPSGPTVIYETRHHTFRIVVGAILSGGGATAFGVLATVQAGVVGHAQAYVNGSCFAGAQTSYCPDQQQRLSDAQSLETLYAGLAIGTVVVGATLAVLSSWPYTRAVRQRRSARWMITPTATGAPLGATLTVVHF